MQTAQTSRNDPARIGDLLGLIAIGLLLLDALVVVLGLLVPGGAYVLFIVVAGAAIDLTEIVALVGIVLSAVGLARGRRMGGRSTAARGLTLSIVALVVPIVVGIGFSIATDFAPVFF